MYNLQVPQTIPIPMGIPIPIPIPMPMPVPQQSSNIPPHRAPSSHPVNTNNTTTTEMQMASAYRIGRYTAAERRLRIERYRQKRSRRNFNNKVLYACRKRIADRRTRVHGRFVKQAGRPDNDHVNVNNDDSSNSTNNININNNDDIDALGPHVEAGAIATCVGLDLSDQFLNICEDDERYK